MSRTDEPDSGPEENTADASGVEEANPVEWDEASNNRKDPDERRTVSHREEKDDARKIVTGEAKYAADYAPDFPDLAAAEIVRSDIAHGRVENIDTSAAEAMDGVYAVLTPDSPEVPDRPYTTAGQSYPEPSPWDIRVLRRTVRFVGDPIAAVAAKDADTASKAASTSPISPSPWASMFRS